MLPTNHKTKRGSHWVPILIMTLLFSVGTILFFVLPYGSSAPESSVAADAGMPWFRIENGTLSFSKDDYRGSSELTVPSSVAGQQVLALSEGCFENCTGLTAVHLPENCRPLVRMPSGGAPPCGVWTFRNQSVLSVQALSRAVLPWRQCG